MVGDNPMYISSDHVMGSAAVVSPDTSSRQFINPLYDYNDDENEQEDVDYATVRGDKAGLINTNPLDEARYVRGP